MRFEHNQAGRAIGALNVGGILAATNTAFVANSAQTGAGAVAVSSAAQFQGVRFEGNQAGGLSGALAVDGSLTAANTVFISNTARNVGAAFVLGHAILQDVRFEHNHAVTNDGALRVVRSLAATNTVFISNTAGAATGAVFLTGNTTRPSRLVNVLLADNQSGNHGAALDMQGSLSGSSLQILHTTIAAPNPSSGEAIFIDAGTVTLSNTIVAGYATDIDNAGGTVSGDHNLLTGNTVTISGTTALTHSVAGNPFFVDPAHGDYHLSASSAAVDAGIDTGLAFDFEGDPRPQGDGPDVGFDESPFAVFSDLGLTKSVTPTSPVLPGQAITYTLVFTHAGNRTSHNVVITDLISTGLLTGLASIHRGADVTATGEAGSAWSVADLSAQSGGVITLTGFVSSTLAEDITFTNTAVIDGDNDDVSDNNIGQTPVTVHVPRVHFATGVYTVSEGSGIVPITVTLNSANPFAAVTVVYSTTNGTARAGQDYTGVRHTLTLAKGQTTAVTTIPITDDNQVESTESFSIQLSSPHGAVVDSPDTATVEIVDNEVSLAIAAVDADKAEGNSGATSFSFNVTRSGDTSGTTLVDYAVSGSGANAANGEDFVGSVLPSGTISFGPGVISRLVTVAVRGDTQVEADEGFVVTLSGATGDAAIVTAAAAGTIRNDDSALPGKHTFLPAVSR